MTNLNSEKEKSKSSSSDAQSHWFKDREHWLKILLFLIAIFQLWILWKQFNISADQTNISAHQSAQSDSLFAYTKKRDSIHDRNDSIMKVKDSSSNNRKDSLLGISLSNSTRQIALSEKSFELERPVISFVSMKLLDYDPGKPLKIGATFRNTGKVDAVDFSSCWSLITGPKKFVRQAEMPKCDGPDNLFNVGVGESAHTSISGEKIFTQEMAQEFAEQKFLISADIRGSYYRSVDRKKYFYEYCFFYDLKNSSWDACDNVKNGN